MSSWLWSWEWFPANLCVWILAVIVLLGGIWLIITIIKEIVDAIFDQIRLGYIMIDLDKEIELYKSKVAFYESQNTRGEYAVTVRELKFVVETLEALRSERSQGDLISRSALKEQFLKAGKDYNHECVIEMQSALETIDKAPTVPQVTVFTENADEQAVADLKVELQNVLDNERPHGECCDSCYLCDVADCEADMREGDKHEQ